MAARVCCAPAPLHIEAAPQSVRLHTNQSGFFSEPLIQLIYNIQQTSIKKILIIITFCNGVLKGNREFS